MRGAAASAAGIVLAPTAGAILGGCGSPCSICVPDAPHEHVLADLHAHPLLNDWIKRSPTAGRLPSEVADIATGILNRTAVTFETSYRARVDLICVSHFNLFDEWATMPTDPNPHAPVNTLHMMQLLEDFLADKAPDWAALVRDRQELEDRLIVAKDDPEWRIAVVHALEGGHSLGGEIAPLEMFAERGVALITITHFFNKGIATAVNSYPYFPDAFSDPPAQGLSEFGEEVIERMEELGIIVDLTHSTSTAVEQVLKCAKRPLLVSHGSSATLGIHPMGLEDEHAIEITRRGGLVGVILMPYWLNNFSNDGLAQEHGGLRDTVRTVRHLVKVTGSHKNVAIGTDFGGYITKPYDMKCQAEIEKLRILLHEEFDRDGNVSGDIVGGTAGSSVGGTVDDAADDVVGDLLAGNAKRFLLKNWGP